MSLVSDVSTAVVFALVILAWQVVAINILGPNSELFQMVAQANHLDGQARAEFWYRIAVLWGPLIGYFTLSAFPIVRAYRRQAATARVPR